MLRGTERQRVRGIIENVFNSQYSEHDTHHIYDDEGGFCIIELINRPNLFWVAPEHRGKRKGYEIVKRLAEYVKRIIPTGQSVMVVASSRSHEKLCQKMGMRKVEGTLYRYDK